MIKMLTRQITGDKTKRLPPHALFQNEHGDGVHRLLLLENAVLNYSGGIVSLESRVSHAANELHGSELPAALLLKDIARYLRDIAEAGGLDIGEWSDEHERRGNNA